MYIICSQGATTDKDTGAYSVFEIIDKLVITELPKPKAGEGVLVIERQRFVITASWMIDTQNGETFDDEFEMQLLASMENGEKVMDDLRTFKFLAPDHIIHRQTYNLLGTMPIKNSGTLVIESRARKVGSKSWKSQRYHVIIEKQKLDLKSQDSSK